MITSTLIQQFERDLDRLNKELLAYNNEKVLWSVNKDIKNSGGNLAIHLVGNLQHFIGHVLGKTDYVRDRPFEFAGKDVPIADIINDIEHTKGVIKTSLQQLTKEDLDKPFPVQISKDFEFSTIGFLLHLSAHLNYHLGQLNYHRRLLDY